MSDTKKAGSLPKWCGGGLTAVVLFDEIEKAHTEVFNVLLQLLDEGRLTDGQGRTVDFRNTVVIMTSNLGAELWRTGQTVETEDVRQALQRHFRPEFLNRIDEIVVFHSLSKEDLQQIVHIQLRQMSRRMQERGLQVEYSPDALAYLAEAGWDPDYGARPLKRAIQREVQDPLALRLLSGEIHAGDVIHIDRGPQGLEFSRASVTV
jgi:ATP-dependent Clp protease ATP-binding subunit ClpB